MTFHVCLIQINVNIMWWYNIQKIFSQMFVEKSLNFKMHLKWYYICQFHFYSLLIWVKICGWQKPVGYKRSFSNINCEWQRKHIPKLNISQQWSKFIFYIEWNTVGNNVSRCLKHGLLSKWIEFNLYTFVIFKWDMYFYNIDIEYW